MEELPRTALPADDPEMERLERLSTLLDNQFRIPGTNLRFGLDGIIGLVPYAGDIAGFLVSGFLMRLMLQKGAGPLVMLRMLGNYAVDTIVGSIPLLGDIFDFGFKANRRNVELLKKYYASGKKRPKARWSLSLLAMSFFLIFGLMIWLVWQAMAWLVGALLG